MERRRHVARGGAPTRPLSTESLSPGRLPTDDPRPAVRVARATLVDTADTVIVFETALEPRLYVEPSVVRTGMLRRTETSTYCNYKGYAKYWAAVVDGTVVDDVAWT